MIYRRRLVAGTLLLLSALLMLPLSTVLLGFRGSGDPEADCVLVFGAAIRRGDQPGPAIRRRVDTAVHLYRSGRTRRLIMTGGVGPGAGVSEARVMADYAVSRGVPVEVLTLEERSRSTMENLLFSKPLTIACTSVLGVSDRYHLARIELLASRTGWGRLPTYPANDLPSVLFEVRSVLRETIGYAYYFLRIDALWDIAPQV